MADNQREMSKSLREEDDATSRLHLRRLEPFFFFSSRRRHTRSVSAFLLNRSSDLIIPMLCVTIFVILVVWFLLPRVARLMIDTPTAISIFVCLSMVQLMAVFISMRCTLCGHFLQVALTLILVVGYAIAAS